MPTFDEALATVEQLQPRPEHFVVFPVDEDPAFDVIDDLSSNIAFVEMPMRKSLVASQQRIAPSYPRSTSA